MSISQPSRAIYVIDVPESQDVQASFKYNFFTPDESVNASGGVPMQFIKRPGAEVDSAFMQYAVTRAPRFVKITWTPVRLGDTGNRSTDQSTREIVLRTIGEQNGSLILDHINSVVNEDAFATSDYVNVHFCDGEIDSKVHELVSGTVVQCSLTQPFDPNNNASGVAAALSATLPGYISRDLVAQSLTQASRSGLIFSSRSTSDGTATTHGLSAGTSDPRTVTPIADGFFEGIKCVGTNAQLNVRFMYDLIGRAIADPTSTLSSDLVPMQAFSKQMKQAVNQRTSSAISENDYKTSVPYFDIQDADRSTHHAQRQVMVIVGYIIDKFEVAADGTITPCPPIVVDDPNVGMTADFQVKFNTHYCYTVRTVAMLTLPAINVDDGTLAITKTLVSAKPSSRATVSTLKLIAPPPPCDVDFVWDYSTNRLMVTWALPVTSERDIKQFQVFRRTSVDRPFELHKQYNFDDSVVPFPAAEAPEASLLEFIKEPCCWWFDDGFDFNVNTSESRGYIYALGAIDAHGLVSNYSAQFLVWFDRYQNKLQRRLVSHTGAPKSYPNMYIEGELFVNTIVTSGKPNMRLYFNPQYYYYVDDEHRCVPVVRTKQTGGRYKLQFMNVDNFKSTEVDITIDDRTTFVSPLPQPGIVIGPKRRNITTGGQ